jgi:VanZ family protein
MLPLRFPWVWMVPGWVLLATVCIGSLLPSTSLPAIHVEDKILHAGSYFLLMVWFAGLYPRRHHFWIAAVLVALGIALDLAQGRMSTRTFDVLDIAANAGGILLGLLLSLSLLGGWCQRIEQRLFA